MKHPELRGLGLLEYNKALKKKYRLLKHVTRKRPFYPFSHLHKTDRPAYLREWAKFNHEGNRMEELIARRVAKKAWDLTAPEKVCPHCDVMKPRSEYYIRPDGRWYSICKECQKSYVTDNISRNRDRHNNYVKKYWKKKGGAKVRRSYQRSMYHKNKDKPVISDE